MTTQDEQIRRLQLKLQAERDAATTKGRSVVEKDSSVTAQRQERAIQRAQERIDKRDRQRAMSSGDILGDVVKSGAAGLAKGVISTPGMPADMVRLGQLAKTYAGAKLQGRPFEAALEEDDKNRTIDPALLEKWGGESWSSGVDYDPQSTWGEAAGTLGQAVGGAAAGGAGGAFGSAARVGARSVASGATRAARAQAIRKMERLPREVLTSGVAPGAAMAGTGAVTDDPRWQTAAALVAGPLAKVYGGNTAENAIRASTNQLSRDQAGEASRLFRLAQTNGVPLSMAQAIDAAAGGRARLSSLQRIIESGDSEAFRTFYADTPDRVRAYGNRTLDTIGPRSTEPGTIGTRVAREGAGAVERAERGVNDATRSQYETFGPRTANPDSLAELERSQIFQDTNQRVMTDPELAPFIEGPPQPRQPPTPPGRLFENLPPGSQGGPEPPIPPVGGVIPREPGLPRDSAAVIDKTRQLLDERAGNLVTPGASPEGTSQARSTGVGISSDRVRDVASEASTPGAQPTFPGVLTPLEEAQQQQAILREQNVQPLVSGPEGQTGRMGGPNNETATTKGVEGAYFPKNPNEGSHVEIQRAIGNLAERDPALASEFVRNYLGSEFNTAATGRNVAGVPDTAGSKFVKSVMGNDQQTLNLQAAVSALPNGAQRWEAMQDMAGVFNAMGLRQAQGSLTATNLAAREALQAGNWGEAAIKYFTGGLGAVKDSVERVRLGQNMDEIADLMTNPAREQELLRIVSAPRGSAERAIALTQALRPREQAIRPAVEAEEDKPMILQGIKPRGTQ